MVLDPQGGTVLKMIGKTREKDHPSFLGRPRCVMIPFSLPVFEKASILLRVLGGPMADSAAQRLASLTKLPKAALCELCKHLFHEPALCQLRKDLMLQILAYRIQEQAFGSLSAVSRSRLRQLARAFEADAKSAIVPMPNIKPGTRLVRKWRDQVHLVNVEARGYEYQGLRYHSLSEIARLITGTRWSGPLFFGLKGKQATNSKEVV